MLSQGSLTGLVEGLHFLDNRSDYDAEVWLKCLDDRATGPHGFESSRFAHGAALKREGRFLSSSVV